LSLSIISPATGARWCRPLICAALLSLLGACAGSPPNERETGSGGTLVRYSSRQVEVDLTDSERQALQGLRERRFEGAAPAQALEAVAAALTGLGFAPVSVDRDTGLVEAGRSEVLIPKARQLLRGILKTRIGMLPARPDHERMAAIATVRAREDGRGVLVRVRFDRTVWDSNGDSRTKAVLDREIYEGFFAQTGKALCSPSCVP
jgi:hypothetical protein